MRWIWHGNLTPAVIDALKARGDTVSSAAELKIDAENPAELLKEASRQQLDVITTDSALAGAPFDGDGVSFHRSIVYLQLEGGEVEQDDAIGRLFKRYARLTPGRLYTVTGTRVKIRQLPSR